MNARYITVKGSNTLGPAPYYIGLVQHERTMNKKETYAYCAEKTGFKPTQVRAVFMALAEYVRENQGRGNLTDKHGVASFRNYVTGAFEGLAGPWVKGKNLIVVNAVEMKPFKSLLAGATLVNNTEGGVDKDHTIFESWEGSDTTFSIDEVTAEMLGEIQDSDLAYVTFTNAAGSAEATVTVYVP